MFWTWQWHHYLYEVVVDADDKDEEDDDGEDYEDVVCCRAFPRILWLSIRGISSTNLGVETKNRSWGRTKVGRMQLTDATNF